MFLESFKHGEFILIRLPVYSDVHINNNLTIKTASEEYILLAPLVDYCIALRVLNYVQEMWFLFITVGIE